MKNHEFREDVANLQIEYTVLKKGWPICQSMPIAAGEAALGHVKHRLGLVAVGPIK